MVAVDGATAAELLRRRFSTQGDALLMLVSSLSRSLADDGIRDDLSGTREDILGERAQPAPAGRATRMDGLLARLGLPLPRRRRPVKAAPLLREEAARIIDGFRRATRQLIRVAPYRTAMFPIEELLLLRALCDEQPVVRPVECSRQINEGLQRVGVVEFGCRLLIGQLGSVYGVELALHDLADLPPGRSPSRPGKVVRGQRQQTQLFQHKVERLAGLRVLASREASQEGKQGSLDVGHQGVQAQLDEIGVRGALPGFHERVCSGHPDQADRYCCVHAVASHHLSVEGSRITEIRAVDQVASDTRLRSSTTPARPNIWRLSILILSTCPSTTPKCRCRVRLAMTASRSRSMPAARVWRSSSGLHADAQNLSGVS